MAISRSLEWSEIHEAGEKKLNQALKLLEEFAELTSDWPMSEVMPAPFHKAYNEIALYRLRWQRMIATFEKSA